MALLSLDSSSFGESNNLEAAVIAAASGDLGDAVLTTVPPTSTSSPPLSAGKSYRILTVGTYVNFPGISGTPVVVPAPPAGSALYGGRLYYNGTYWAASFTYQPLPTVDVSGKLDVSQFTPVLDYTNILKGVIKSGVDIPADITHVFPDSSGKYSVWITNDGTLHVKKLDFPAASVSFSKLDPSVTGLMAKFIASNSGFVWAVTDVNDRVALGVRSDGSLFLGNVFGLVNRLVGKKWLAIGDSISAADLYQKVVVKATGLTYANHAKPGISVAQMIDGDGAGFAALAVAEVTGVDVITLFGGLNNRTIPIGVSGDVYPAQNTFFGQLNYAVKKIYELLASAGNTTARLALVIPHKVGRNGYILATASEEYPVGSGRTFADMIPVYKSVGQNFGIPVIDLFANSGINDYNWPVTTVNTVVSSAPDPTQPDNVHLSVYGNNLIGTHIGYRLNSLY